MRRNIHTGTETNLLRRHECRYIKEKQEDKNLYSTADRIKKATQGHVFIRLLKSICNVNTQLA